MKWFPLVALCLTLASGGSGPASRGPMRAQKTLPKALRAKAHKVALVK